MLIHARLATLGGSLGVLLLCCLPLSPMFAAGVSAAKCDGCSEQEPCGSELATCRSECRARIFSIDPRRETCLKACAEDQLKCIELPISERSLRSKSQTQAVSGPRQ
jgi:hypothetical protein